MHRSELNQIAHALKSQRPDQHPVTKAGEQTLDSQWEDSVEAMADALELKDKARSNFMAASGFKDYGNGGEP